MKKSLTLLLSGLLLGATLLAGCGTASTDKPTTGSSNDSGVSADVKTIQDRGVLKVGVKSDVPKFGYKNPTTGQYEGFEIDLAKALAKEILGSEDKVQFETVTAKTRGPLLDNGTVDMDISTFTVTEERKKSYNFSDSYFTDGIGLLVKKDSGIKSLKDLNGKKVGVAQSATTKTAFQAEADKQGVKVQFLEFASYPEIKSALDSGRVDCFSVDGAILNGYLDDSTVILDDRFSPQEYGVATKLSNKGLAQLVNDKIDALKQSGDLQKMIDKWGIK